MRRYELIVALVLAAGLSRRFPGNKLLFMWEDKPIIRWTVENILNSKNVDKTVVVLGHDEERIRNVLKDLVGDIEFVYNTNYLEGMSSSVKAGIRHVYNKYKDSIEAIIIAPGDTAWAPPEVYDLIVDVFREKKPKIVVAAYNSRRGHPILFNADLINELMSISEETRGLKAITKKYKYETIVVDTIYPGVILDLDTYNDLNRVKYVLKK
ncbi:nucleotidyltransferase family protein [Staphylothermus marinus]|uniref:nucleotidyltransferase family protein n=1 Tax=Staphylothermus marinus TaxID=2280 RepID=UPI0003265166|nr:nucleotidyltransferase family protein [Staphylothermus marinus]